MQKMALKTYQIMKCCKIFEKPKKLNVASKKLTNSLMNDPKHSSQRPCKTQKAHERRLIISFPMFLKRVWLLKQSFAVLICIAWTALFKSNVCLNEIRASAFFADGGLFGWPESSRIHLTVVKYSLALGSFSLLLLCRS